MTPAQAIGMLDRQLAKHGQTVTLRKTNTAVGEQQTRAFVRHYKPAEITGILQQGDRLVVLSPTGIGAFGVPPANGFIVINGAPCRIVAAPEQVEVDGTLVRVNATVRG